MFELIQGLNHWQICALATWLLLQGAVFAIAPEEVVILSMGVLWGEGKINLVEGLISIYLGLLPANNAMVFVSSRFSGLKFFQKPAVLSAVEMFKKRGRWVIFMTRFTPFVRAPVYAAVGLSGIPQSVFFILDGSAALIQVPALMCLGSYIGQKTGSITAAYKLIGFTALGVAGSVLVFVLIRDRLKIGKSAA
jgi:membrane protein DedA with SNARE-associated domain